MGSGRKPYPPEVKDRAVRLVYGWRGAREQDYGGFYEIGKQLGIHGESIRNWMRQGEIDGGATGSRPVNGRAWSNSNARTASCAGMKYSQS